METRLSSFRINVRQAAFMLGCWLACVMVLSQSAYGQGQPVAVEIELEQFGVGSVYRPGEFTGIRLRLTNNPAGPLDEAVAVKVQVEIPDVDGDIVEYSREVTLTRGRATPVWLYVPLPPDLQRDALLPVRIFEMRDGRQRAEIAGRRISPREVNAQRVDLAHSKIGVIGRRSMGLDGYRVLPGQMDRPPAAHEFTRIETGLRPDALPDRWEGLNGFEAIAWSEGSPRDLTSDSGAALREYVRRGGHLIITLPEDTNPWQFGVSGQHPLEDMLPRTEPRKDEAVSIRELVPVLSKARGTDVEFDYGIRVFKDLRGDFDALDNHFEPVIAMPDGRVVVVRRTFGFGWVTVIGIDVAQQRLYNIPLSNGARGLPQADAFWNQILGRRVDTPTAGEYQAMREAEVLVRSTPAEHDLGGGELMMAEIAMTRRAGMGLMLALLLFAGYWLLAGPGGFGLLKVYGKVKHAWIAFVIAAFAFTLVAWGSVSVLRVSHPEIQHFSVLDHVARPGDSDRPEDPQLQRALSWFSLYTPGYGRVPVAIESMPGQRDLLTSWIPPEEQVAPFPNVDRYEINVGRQPAAYTIPSRSTATQMHANWAGGMESRWGSMIRAELDYPVEVETIPGDLAPREVGLRGVLRHDLPGTLQDVTLIWVRNLRHRPRQYAGDDIEAAWVRPLQSGQMTNLGYMLRLPPWEPGDRLNLSTLDFVPDAILERSISGRYVDEYRPTGLGRTAVGTAMRTADRRRYLEMLSMYHQLTPPTYVRSRAEERDPTDLVAFSRLMARELDLSTWFTRPCLIIIGYLEDSETPLPIRVANEDAPPVSRGLTMVRWIYPLPLDDEIAFPRLDDADVMRGLEGIDREGE